MVQKYFKILCHKEGYHLVDPSTVKSVFACGVCQKHYNSKEDAQKCESLPCKELIFKKGDKVKLVNLDFIEWPDDSKNKVIGEKGKIMPNVDYRLENNQHIPLYYVAFDNAHEKSKVDGFPCLLALCTLGLPEKSLEKVIEDKTPQQ